MRNLINIEQNENSHRSFQRSFDNGPGVMGIESFNHRRDKQQHNQQPNPYESNMQYSMNNSKLDLESPRDFFNNERQNLVGHTERVGVGINLKNFKLYIGIDNFLFRWRSPRLIKAAMRKFTIWTRGSDE